MENRGEGTLGGHVYAIWYGDDRVPKEKCGYERSVFFVVRPGGVVMTSLDR